MFQIMKMDQVTLRKGNANTTNYVKTQMRENHEGREKIHYNNGNYNGILW